MLKNFLISYLFFCFFNSFALSEEKFELINVEVFEKGSGRLLQRVEINSALQKEFSDTKGTAQIKYDANDLNFNLQFYRPNYEKLVLNQEQIKESLKSSPDSPSKKLSVYLFPSVPDDNEVIITGRKRFESSKKIISVSEAKKIAPRGDVVQITKLLPGVQTQGFSPNIIVRGSGPEDSKYYLDEWSLPFVFHSIGGISVLSPEILSDIEFNSGGFGAQYGEATGGIIGIKTKQDIPDRSRLEILVNLPLYSGIFYETPIGDDEKSFLSLSARRSYIEYILPKILPDDMNLTLTPYFSDAQAYYYRQLEDGHIKWLFLGAVDGLKLLFDTELSTEEDGRGRVDIFQSFYTTGLEWRTKLNNDWSLQISPQITHFENNFNFLDLFFRLYVDSFNLRSEISKTRSRNERTYFGSEILVANGRIKTFSPKGNFQDPFFDIEEAERVEAKDNATVTQLSLWAAYDKQIKQFVLTPGLRATHASIINKYSFDPRLTSRWLWSEEQTLKLSVGQYSQVPGFRDTSPQFGNPDLEFIRSYQYVLGIESKWSEKWSSDIQAFHKKLYKLVAPSEEKNVESTGSGEANGVEFFVRRNQTARFFGWLSYTYSKNIYRENDRLTFRNSEYDQTHVANIAGNYALNAVWDLGGKLSYHSGDTFTGVDDAVYNANFDKYQQRRFADSRDYNERLPDFHEINIYATKDWLFDVWKLELRFGVEFLALSPQARDVQYNYDFSKEEYFTSLPPIPYIELKGVL